jgi:hypothetical protein
VSNRFRERTEFHAALFQIVEHRYSAVHGIGERRAKQGGSNLHDYLSATTACRSAGRQSRKTRLPAEPILCSDVRMRGFLIALELAAFIALLQGQEGRGAGGAQTGASASMSPPRVLSRADPEYTHQALDAKLEGIVILAFTIGTDGTATGITVTRGLGMGLDEKAVECAPLIELDIRTCANRNAFHSGGRRTDRKHSAVSL